MGGRACTPTQALPPIYPHYTIACDYMTESNTRLLEIPTHISDIQQVLSDQRMKIVNLKCTATSCRTVPMIFYQKIR